MPKRNRVLPTGEIVATPLRGAWMGNRGVLHSDGELVRSQRGPLWLICVLERDGRRVPQWQDGHYTVLFFHDEAVALAAGHRPCAYCRREAYERFRRALAGDGPVPSAKELDRRLHAERQVRGTSRRRLHRASWADLPAGAFVLRDGEPTLVLADTVVPWTTQGYQAPRARPATGTVDLLTPPSTVAALAAGYPVQIAAAG